LLDFLSSGLSIRSESHLSAERFPYDKRNWKPRAATIYDERTGFRGRECRFRAGFHLPTCLLEEIIEC
jgi:hypothetical protein